MTTAAVMSVITSDVRGHEPLHAATQVLALLNFDQQMKMVGHQAVGEETSMGSGFQVAKLARKKNTDSIPLNSL
jgi:hypothetical protein